MKRLVVLIGISLFCGVTFCQEATLLLGRGSGLNSRDRARVNTTITRMNALSTTEGVLDVDSIYLSLSHSTNNYRGLLGAEWTPGAAMTAGGTNGIYSIINPVENLQNAYGLRSRVDMRDATGGVAVNQVHGIDGLLNFSDQAYTVIDNISVFGAAAHAVDPSAANITGTSADASMNLYYGVWGESVDRNFTIPTNGVLIVTHLGTHLDYGFQIQNSGAATAGLYIKNHASKSPATMRNGILIESAEDKMVYGLNMEGASIDSVDIIFQNGALIYNNDADTLRFEEKYFAFQGIIHMEGQTVSDFAITDDQPSLKKYWAETKKENRLPAFKDKDRRNLTVYLNGLEEAAERNLRYIVELEARLRILEDKQNNSGSGYSITHGFVNSPL